jgi:hypothetical protein
MRRIASSCAGEDAGVLEGGREQLGKRPLVGGGGVEAAPDLLGEQPAKVLGAARRLAEGERAFQPHVLVEPGAQGALQQPAEVEAAEDAVEVRALGRLAPLVDAAVNIDGEPGERLERRGVVVPQRVEEVLEKRRRGHLRAGRHDDVGHGRSCLPRPRQVCVEDAVEELQVVTPLHQRGAQGRPNALAIGEARGLEGTSGVDGLAGRHRHADPAQPRHQAEDDAAGDIAGHGRPRAGSGVVRFADIHP